MSAPILRAIFFAWSPDFREQAADLRDCRIYLAGRAAWVRLGDLSEAEIAVLAQVAAEPAYCVRWYGDRRPGQLPGVRVSRFATSEEAETFARGRRYQARPARVERLGVSS